MDKETFTALTLKIERLEYLIIKVMGDLEDNDRVSASIGASMALDMIGEIRHTITEMADGSNKQ